MAAEIVIKQSRRLPALQAITATALAAVFYFSNEVLPYRLVIPLIFFPLACWWFYVSKNPRWVLKVEGGALYFQNPMNGKVTEIPGSIIKSLRLKKYVGDSADGIGFQNELLVETDQQTITFSLPIMEISAAKAMDLLASCLPKN